MKGLLRRLLDRDGDPVARRYYRRLVLAVTGVSLGGTLLAAMWPCAAAHGGRGGAIGVVIALGAIWMKPDLHLSLLQRVREREAGRRGSGPVPAAPPEAATADDDEIEPLTTADLTVRVLATDSAIRLGAAYDDQSVFWLALSTMIATFFWGFGDLLAAWLRLAVVGVERCCG